MAWWNWSFQQAACLLVTEQVQSVLWQDDVQQVYLMLLIGSKTCHNLSPATSSITHFLHSLVAYSSIWLRRWPHTEPIHSGWGTDDALNLQRYTAVCYRGQLQRSVVGGHRQPLWYVTITSRQSAIGPDYVNSSSPETARNGGCDQRWGPEWFDGDWI